MQLGTISYDIEVSTESLLKSQRAVDVSTDKMTAEFKKVDKSVNQLNATVKKSAQGVNRALKANFGQAGIQIQQLVGQIQAGQSAMVALAQQSADLGIVLGAPLVGVFVSLAAVVAGTLAPALFDSKTAMEKLEKAVEQVKAVMTLGADGVANYSDEMQRLAGISESLTKLKIASTISAQNEAIKISVAGIKETLDDTRGSFDSYADQVSKITGKTSGKDAFTDAERALRDYNSTVSTFASSGDVAALEAALTRLSDAGASNTKAGRELISQTVNLIQAYREGQITLEALNGAIDDNTVITSEAKTQMQQLTESLILQRTELVDGERAALDLKLTMDGLSQSERNAALAIYDSNEAIRQQQQEAEQSAQSIQKVNDALDSFFERESRQSQQQQQRDQAGAERFAAGVIQRGMTPDERFAQEQERLNELREQALISQELYDQAVVASVERRAAEIQQIEAQQRELTRQNTSMIIGSTADIFGNIAAIIKNSSGEQNSAYKTLFAISKAFAIAQAGLNLSTAISNALAVPFPANIPAIAQATAAGTQILGQISGATYSGARETGGPVSAGSQYRVGEKGRPEFFKDRLTGNLSMIPGQNGEVIPADKMGANWTINVNNNGPDKAYATVDDVQRVVTVSIGQADKKRQRGLAKGTSSESQILRSTSNLSNRATN